MLDCKICDGKVVWCGSEEHNKHSGDEIHACHQLVCLKCSTVYDIGYNPRVLNSSGDDDSWEESLRKNKENILDIYLNGYHE